MSANEPPRRTANPTPAATEKVASDIPPGSAALRAAGNETTAETAAGTVSQAAPRAARLQARDPARARRSSSTTTRPRRTPSPPTFQASAAYVEARIRSRSRTHSSGSFRAVARPEGTPPASPTLARSRASPARSASDS